MLKLAERYPDIYFLLTVTPHTPCRLTKQAKKLEKWFQHQPHAQLEILYIVGLIGYPLPEAIEAWLGERPERALVFIEQRLGAFTAFDQPKLMANPQIHFIYSEEDPTEELAKQFPSERIAVFEGRPFDVFTLKRRSAAYSALYSDVLYSHKIVENVLHNMRWLKTAFTPTGDLCGIPLLICGAGPSLDQAIPILKAYQNRVLILAVGSGITALTRQGITPHMAMALDPNDDEFTHLAQGRFFEGPFLFSPRLHRKVFSTSNGPFGFLQSDTGGLIERYLIDEMGVQKASSGPDLGSEAFSVTTLALCWASSVGFSDIALVGVDLAFSNGKRYASDFEADQLQVTDAPTLDQLIDAKDLYGKQCQTMTKWIMEADVISRFAALNSKVDVVNCSMAGLNLKGIKNRPIEQWLSSFAQQDIGGWVHQFCQTELIAFDKERYQKLLSRLAESLQRCAVLCEEIPTVNSIGKKMLLICDLEEEPAYIALLEGIDRALQHLLVRYYPHLEPEIIKGKREAARYLELGRQITLFTQLMDLLAQNRESSLR